MDTTRPIVIVGPHRSGTTLLYRTLAAHPELGFFNRNNKRWPRFPRLAWLLTRLEHVDQPMECQPVWDRFKTRDDDVMDASDAPAPVVAWYRRLVAQVLSQRRARRLVAKYPRLSLRLPWLDALFPDARYVHVVRDWRAVVNSTVNRKRKRSGRGGGWFGVYVPGWQALCDLPHDVAATRQFVSVTRTLEQEAQRRPGRVLRVSYQEFCRDPRDCGRKLAEELGLPWSRAFEATLPEQTRSANYKWREQLGAETVARLRQEDPELLARYEDPVS